MRGCLALALSVCINSAQVLEELLMMGRPVMGELIETSELMMTQLRVRRARGSQQEVASSSGTDPARPANSTQAPPPATVVQNRRYAHLNYERILNVVKALG